ncbi:MAG: hypothetical protein KC503_01445 [Myxococcales bacterium]|nr:hypothetical protein [Myxococcales bacterium]
MLRWVVVSIALLSVACADAPAADVEAGAVAVDAALEPARAPVDLAADAPAPGPRDAAPAAADAPADAAVDAASSTPTCPSGRWCSALYPPSWTPLQPADSQGRFLHDFSYAGYHNGEDPMPSSPPGGHFDAVADFGADPTGATDSTQAIQSAIDAASVAGGVVMLSAGSFRLDGELAIRASRVVLRGAGAGMTRLLFTSHAGRGGKSHLSIRGSVARGADLALAADAPNRARVIRLASVAGLSLGDDVALGWVITPAFLADHGMTGIWTTFEGQWKPIFRRTIVAIDASATPPTVTLDVPLRHAASLRDQASLRRESGYVRESGIEQLSVANAVAWADAWKEHQVQAIGVDDATDCWVRDVTSVESPGATGHSGFDTRKYHLQSGGVRVQNSKRVTVRGVAMRNAQNRGSGGDGYLFQVSRSSEILIVDSHGENGRHNFIQNWDFGTSGCVFLRCTSRGSEYVTMLLGVPLITPARCEYHHSLAMANLVDSCQLDDGWQTFNRFGESSGAGHTATQSVFWNTRGAGTLQSLQFGWGYVIGTAPSVVLDTAIGGLFATGTAPADFVEGAGSAATLHPTSLYEDQLARRHAP